MGKSLKTLLLGAFLIIGLFSLALAIEEKLTITTYYPSPYGSYKDLYVTNTLGIGTASPNQKLHIYSDTADAILVVDAPNNELYDVLTAYRITGQIVWNTGIDNNDSNKFKISSGGGWSNIGTGDRLTIDTSGNTIITGTLTVNGVQTGALDHVFDNYDDIELLRKWRKGESLPFETGDILNRDRLLRDAIMQLAEQVQQQKQQIELLKKKLQH